MELLPPWQQEPAYNMLLISLGVPFFYHTGYNLP